MNSSSGLDWVVPDFDDSAWLTGYTGVGYDYGNLIGLNTGAMRYVNPTVYCRMAFDVEAVTDLISLTLRMNYEDGFVAYLNGIEVARDNAPTGDALSWNASALSTREDSDAQVEVDFALPDESLDALIVGKNVLAVHGLNTNANSSDLLVLPELIGVTASNSQTTREEGGYFTVATPGTPNGRIQVTSGPRVFDVNAVPAVLQASDHLLVTARVSSLKDPVIQWFVQNVGASENDTRTRGSVYFLGEFYDNVTIKRRGGNTAGAVKTHFKLNFNEGRKFRFDPDVARVNEINLNSTYSDKAYLRQALAFEAYDCKWANPWSWGGQGGYDRDQNFGQALTILKTDYLAVRRHHLFVTHLADNAARYPIPGSYSAKIPDEQSIHYVIEIADVDSDPASGNQDEEYVELVNLQDCAVDLTGWQLTGAVSHEFLPGTVIAAGGRLYVSPNARAFLNRAISPKRGEGCFVQGDYRGHLSNWGEPLYLVDRYGVEVSSISIPGTPSDQQQSLRISEIMYHPADPGTGIYPEDLEYVELLNIGDSDVSLEEVRFTQGISFELPSVTLGAHTCVVVAKSPDALALVQTSRV